MKENYGTLQEAIEVVEYQYNVVSFREYPGAPLSRTSYLLEDSLLSYPAAKGSKYYCGYLYVRDLLTVDFIVKKDNCIRPRYIPQIEKALKAVLSHSRKVPLEPDEWTVMTEVAKRVKEKLPKIKIVPDGQEYKYFSYGTDN